jgi:hypothetical protein
MISLLVTSCFHLHVEVYCVANRQLSFKPRNDIKISTYYLKFYGSTIIIGVFTHKDTRIKTMSSDIVPETLIFTRDFPPCLLVKCF